jgi:hypothetical protein
MNTFNNHNIQRLLQEYGNFFHDQIAYGKQGYLFSFMFRHIPGSDNSRLLEMKKHLGWFYGRLAKASVPRASHPKWSPFLPKAILAPDFPVFKHAKQSLRDVTVNNGLHWHGLILKHPFGPCLHEPLDVHIQENLGKYLVGSIRQIDVKAITHDPEYVTGYGLKALKSKVSTDEILIFPRSVSELPSREPVRAAGERVTYDFQRG